MAVTCQLYRDGQIADEGFDPSKVSDFLAEKDTLVWLDVEDPSPDEIAMLEEEFSLHPLAIEDAIHRDQRPKVEVYEGYFFIVLQALRLEDKEIANQEIHCFVGEGYLITLRSPPAFDLSEVRRRWKEEQDLAREGGGYLLHALIDEVVDGYFDIIDTVELKIEDLEEMVFGERAAEGIQQRIFHAKKELTEFRRRVMPLREVLDLLEENRRVVTPELRPYYRDVADHVIRALESIDQLREILTAALDAHLSRVSTEMNKVMKQVTSWAAILLVPTVIAGIYGMNFVNPFPGYRTSWGFWFAIGLMIVAGGGLWWAFKRRDWL